MPPGKLTTRYVNAQLKKAGIRLDLVQGKGYLYFEVPSERLQQWADSNVSAHDTYKVDVCWLNHLDLQDWMARAHRANEVIWCIPVPEAM